MNTQMRILAAAAFAAALAGCSSEAVPDVPEKAGRKPVGEVKLVTLDPGHFHAALVQNRTYEGVSPDVRVYAPAGDELESHLALIKKFNTRKDAPTAWCEHVYRSPDYLQKMIADKAGNVVVLAGKNNIKPLYYSSAVDAGFNVLSDKPMAITPDAFAVLEKTVAEAERKGLYFADIMTERNEITTILQRFLVSRKDLYGEQEKGTPGDPAVTKESVHHFCKLVNGEPLRRPAWYYDTAQQGEAIVDVTTHLVDLVQWETFPGETLSYGDVKMLKARGWPTPVTAENYRTSTGLAVWPEYLRKNVDGDNVLQCMANGEFVYTLRGVHAKVSVLWRFMPPEGTGDTHYSLMRGTKAEIVIRQGAEEGYKPRVYVFPREGTDAKASLAALSGAVAEFCKAYPGVSFRGHGRGWILDIPAKYDIGHEAHFSQVMRMYLGWMRKGGMPDGYLQNLLVKYYTLSEAWKLAHE